jgi:arginine/lysine/ornithine decarboxylase
MMPIYEMLKKYSKTNPLPFHMPGHVLGRGLAEEMKAAGSLDITEIPGSDCLHHPDGVIKDAQMLASRCFGSDYTYFMVNGSTSGIHAMLQAALDPGDKIILGRDCHISVLNGLAQLNCEPVFVLPRIDEEYHIPLGVTAADLEPVIKANPDARCIFVTRPGYYGTAAKLEEIVRTTHDHNIPLLVDEAHGAHFRFHKNLPQTAMDAGADLCVQSLHKTLPALTQTALLHRKENGMISGKRIDKTVSMVQTTSPSYILMASMDIARDIMEKQGEYLYEKLSQMIDDFDRKLEKETEVKRYKCSKEGFDNDFSRIVLNFEALGISGFQVEELLRTQFGIVAEMADPCNVVLIATPFHTSEDFDKLLSALKNISLRYRMAGDSRHRLLSSFPYYLPKRIKSVREALFAEKRVLPAEKSAGEICGSFITPYPPGIPMICPGELITADMAEYVSTLNKCGYAIHGVNNGNIEVI